ncbi:MAG TPA: inorganic phosphate transporter [Syntrophothermus lipocalidus]|uniref:Phosphate transporter n=1 Tax=Syntrophothermus lipocalidus (strain DSM 12680 / TGB-C1) TaxID=643648 RepID=D7CL81_SYNLT|nr:inorganic phosphate transporter [Syntrophothermus lipocalidus]ADI01466.1 phosphate transporter [Syntrophothermus lipocalidus DSM 12680]HHV76494.1 inorganic phosphate transporter [Syntrophothermus lipocalidus]HOV43260.1 inorganic phosphate transporter [Syntrophothermus lipocalidus]
MFSLALLLLVIALALLFDYVNGFHDTANAIATSVSTKALTPRGAIMVAAGLNFLGALSGTGVAKTIGKGLVAPEVVTGQVLVAALSGAIFWNIFTWYSGIPSSSSHALIGGVVGAVVAGLGFSSVNWSGFKEILAALILSPVVAFTLGSVIMTILFWIFKDTSPAKINNNFRRLQVLSACMAAFSHGSNDAQKTMGIITMGLVSAGYLRSFDVPLWVIIACAMAMALGTAAGGWKIIRTMGGKIFRIEPINGFAADFTSSCVIYGATLLHAPVSTTHVVSSSIMGVGAAKRFKGVRWGIAQQIITAWLLTIPSSGVVSYMIYKLLGIFPLFR